MVFLAVSLTLVIQVIRIDMDSHRTFFKHGPIEGYFHGANTDPESDLKLAGLTQSEMTDD